MGSTIPAIRFRPGGIDPATSSEYVMRHNILPRTLPRAGALLPAGFRHARAAAPAIALGLAVILSGMQPAAAQSRYSTPPKAVLSGDLASPWILQLNNRNGYNQQNTVQPRRHSNVTRQAPAQRQSARNAAGVQQAAIRPAVVPQPAPKPASQDGLDPKFLPQLVSYGGKHAPGTIVIDTSARFLYLVEEDGLARRYGVGVGREGFEWSGVEKVTRKAEWPEWRPPEQMRERERKKGRELPVVMAGGPDNPLGARALYLGGTLYRIHGTNQPWSIGQALSSGCIRMRNEDVIDLYERVKVGTKVVVL